MTEFLGLNIGGITVRITTNVHVDRARELLRKLKEEGFIVKDNRINREIKVGDVIEVMHPEVFSVKVIGGKDGSKNTKADCIGHRSPNTKSC